MAKPPTIEIYGLQKFFDFSQEEINSCRRCSYLARTDLKITNEKYEGNCRPL